MNKRILGLALPNIITNITVPLLGIVDMAIVGHLSTAHIGAITIGTSIFNLIYWNFGFLRMGTSGLTAQAYGARNQKEIVRIFIRSTLVAIAIALALIAFQKPIGLLAEKIFEGSSHILQMALEYFRIRIWAAPATLGLYAIKGWFIGMQNSKTPMWIAIFINIVNIVFSLLFVIVFKWDIAGVAWGTVIAQYSGLTVGLYFVIKNHGLMFKEHIVANGLRQLISESVKWNEMKQFFKLNFDIFLRTICLAAVFTFITRESGNISDNILAIDAIILQFFTLFSYIMDGFAYAGESLVGKYIGAQNKPDLKKSVKLLIVWGVILTIFFTLLYAVCGDLIMRIFTNDQQLIDNSQQYMFWTLIIPICGFSAFLFDGIFVGATASKTMRNSMFVATIAFFATYFGLKHQLLPSSCDIEQTSNNCLWTAFMIYLTFRGVIQATYLKKDVYNKIKN